MTFNITSESQFARRLELERWRRGDRSVPGPAIGSPLVRPAPSIPAPALHPMSSAPRDGTAIKLYRRAHPNLKHPVVTAYWKQWSAHHGFWNHATLGALGGDEYMIGWEEI